MLARLRIRICRIPRWAIKLLRLQWELVQRQERLAMALVQIEQGDLDNFAAEVAAQATAMNEAAGVLVSYIQKLVSGQAEPLPAADETALNKAVSDLTAASAAVTALEPPAGA